MVLNMESRCPVPGGGSTLRSIREGQQQSLLEERQKYCYPFKEYDPTATNTSSSSRMSHQIGDTFQYSNQRLNSNISNGVRRATISQGTGHHHLSYLDKGQSQNGQSQDSQNQNAPPLPATEPPPLPPKRTTSLMGSGAATLTLLRVPKPRESSTLNPKRISIATSSFWTGHPDMAHFASGWELGRDSMRTQSVWGTTERGGRPVTESVDIWGDPPAVKKGVLLQQREKLWSRWKERYFILTRDYLNCFRRTTSVHRSGVRLSEMGSFIYKLRLAEVDGVEWETRKNGSLIALVLPQEPRILLRVPGDNYEALHQWYTLLQECIFTSKERRRALRSQYGSTHRSTASYNPSASKSVGSASPNSSSKSASNSDLDKSDGEKSLKKLTTNNGLLSLRKISSGSGSNTSPRSLLRRVSNNGKYSPLIDDDDDYDDYDDGPHPQPNPSISQNKGQEEFTVTLRRRREINNNLPHPWRLSQGPGPGMDKTEGVGYGYGSTRGNINKNIPNINNSIKIKSNLANSGYATPIDARPIRPESWTPQPTIFYRTSSLVPSQWMHKRDLPNPNFPRGTQLNQRSSVIYCPSRITSDVTFRKMS